MFNLLGDMTCLGPWDNGNFSSLCLIVKSALLYKNGRFIRCYTFPLHLRRRFVWLNRILYRAKWNGNRCIWLLKEWKFSCGKLVLWTPNDLILMPQDHIPLDVIHFWGPLWEVPFSQHAGKGNCCIWLLKKWKITCVKYVLRTANGPIWMRCARLPGVARIL